MDNIIFDQLSDNWWDPQGPCKPLHTINPLRTKFISDTLTLSKSRILDVGCGGGLLSETLAKHQATVVGIDVSANLIDTARQHAFPYDLSLSYLSCTIEAYQANLPELFDAITCMELLEHVEDPLHILKTCHILLKPGGHLFLSTLNRTFKSYLFAIMGAEYLLKVIPKHTHHYQQFIKPSELMKWLSNAGYRLKKIQGIYYNPWRNTACFCQDLSINYIIHAVSEK